MKPRTLIIAGLFLAAVSAFVGLAKAMLPRPTDAERTIVLLCLFLTGAGILTMLTGIVMAVYRKLRKPTH